METTIEKLVRFVDQRPGLEFCNYGDIKLYRIEAREISNDRNDFYELLNLAFRRINDLNDKVTEYLTRSNDRLTLQDDGNLQYIAGQYFPTEYRPAACRVLSYLIWDDYRREGCYKDGHEIRKAIRRNLSRRCAKNYFN